MDTMTGTEKARRSGWTSWIELSEAAYGWNLGSVRRRIGQRAELSAVVKANAYGHDVGEIAAMAKRHGADSFCVHSLDEAQEIRRLGHGEAILIMGFVPNSRLEEVVEGDFRLGLFTVEGAKGIAEAASRLGRRARLHVKLETGTFRQGLLGDDLGRALGIIGGCPELQIEGVYTHFANIEDTTEHGYAMGQLERFQSLSSKVEAAAGGSVLRHAACSAAAMLYDQTHFEMVRLGLSQYGLWSSKETRLSYQLLHGGEGRDQDSAAEESPLRPVLTWKAVVGEIKEAPAGSFVGYGCTYQTTRETRLGILPIGYSDGYDRRLSNQAHVLIRGRRAPVRGRVCMNLIMVDVTDIPDVSVEDEVVLLGRQGEQEVSAEMLADWAGTIPYEIVTRIRPGIPRVRI